MPDEIPMEKKKREKKEGGRGRRGREKIEPFS